MRNARVLVPILLLVLVTSALSAPALRDRAYGPWQPGHFGSVVQSPAHVRVSYRVTRANDISDEIDRLIADDPIRLAQSPRLRWFRVKHKRWWWYPGSEIQVESIAKNEWDDLARVPD